MPDVKIILTKTEDINPLTINITRKTMMIRWSFILWKSLLWKISLRGIWLLRRVGFKESEALLLFVILKFKFPRKCTNRSDMIPKRSHPLTNSHNGGRRFCNTSSNLENQYVGDSFVAGFPIYVFLSVWMHIFSIFALQIICITCGKHSLLPFPWDNVEYLANKRRALTHSKPNAGCPNIEDRFTGLLPKIFYFAPKHSSWCETLVACQNCPKRVSTIWMSEWHCLFLICLPDLQYGC